MSETSELVKPGLAALCKRWPDGLWVRRNVGAAGFPTKAGGFQMVQFGMRGMADIQGIWRGIAWELEAKMPGEGQSAAQIKWQAAVEKSGGIYIVFNDIGLLLSEVDRRWRIEGDRRLREAISAEHMRRTYHIGRS
jgi:hypothetical protein